MKIPYKKVSNYWNSRNVLLVSILATAFTIYISFSIKDKPFIKHMEEILLILCLGLFLFLFYGLYHGYTWLEGKIKIEWKELHFGKRNDNSVDLHGLELPDLSALSDGDEIGLIGAVIAFIAWILFAVVLVAILIYLFPIVWLFVLFLFSIFNWIFYRALRLVFIHSKNCHGNLKKSGLIALGYTFAYTLWLIAIIYYFDYQRSSLL
ncbi:hypothetical protein EHQ57_10235 [Leptospira wolffii]|uniref:hypothetical protein n=1 Tax=Leptospira wolffii TaxID=409998 RepID=UPI0010827E32|nr:hypothetical protein [Leptospira wolffii]TGL29306.1 hypothetical protein EHQ57_10235 [Leptospira wolffii]